MSSEKTTPESPGESYTYCQKEFSCKHCEKIFWRKDHMIRHEKIHTAEKSFPCSYCEKTFAQKNLRTVHERIHSGEKPYSCNYCGNSYITKSSLKSHEKTHTVPKLFSCKQCDKSFTMKANLENHKQLHEQVRVADEEFQFSCEFCKKAFKRKDHKVRHEKLHTNKEPMSCFKCRASFEDLVDFRTHKKKCKTYVCPVCENVFGSYDGYSKCKNRCEAVKSSMEVIISEQAWVYNCICFQFSDDISNLLFSLTRIDTFHRIGAGLWSRHQKILEPFRLRLLLPREGDIKNF